MRNEALSSTDDEPGIVRALFQDGGHRHAPSPSFVTLIFRGVALSSNGAQVGAEHEMGGCEGTEGPGEPQDRSNPHGQWVGHSLELIFSPSEIPEHDFASRHP